MNIKDNKGMSLIELIVVFAIIGVLIAASAFSIRLLFGTDAKQLTNKLNAALNDVKTGAMSRFNETLTLEYCTTDEGKHISSDGYYSVNELWTIQNNMADPQHIPVEYSIGRESIRLGSSRVDVVAEFADGTQITLGKAGAAGESTLMICYNRATGAMMNCYIIPKGGTKAAATYTGEIKNILVSSGAREYKVAFETGTGRHIIND